MNQALLLAAVMLLWLFPNLIFLAAVTGRDFADSVSTHMGLNSEATQQCRGPLQASSTSTAATVGAIAFLVLAVTATVAVIQKVWQTIWGLERLGYWHEIWQQVLWGFGAIAASAALSYVQHELNKVYPGLAALASFTLLAAFFWIGMHLLLAGRVAYRELIVPAVVTSAFFLGLGAFSAAFLSDAIIANDKEYGPIGVVFIMMTWLLAVGVVFILGPVVGVAIQERWRDRRRRRAKRPEPMGREPLRLQSTRPGAPRSTPPASRPARGGDGSRRPPTTCSRRRRPRASRPGAGGIAPGEACPVARAASGARADCRAAGRERRARQARETGAREPAHAGARRPGAEQRGDAARDAEHRIEPGGAAVRSHASRPASPRRSSARLAAPQSERTARRASLAGRRPRTRGSARRAIALAVDALDRRSSSSSRGAPWSR